MARIRQRLRFVMFSMMTLIAFLSCDSPVMDGVGIEADMDAEGRLVVVISDIESEASVVPPGLLQRVASYEVFVNGEQALGPILTSESTISLEGLPLGEYTVSVSAQSRDGKSLAAGSVPAVFVSAEGVEAIVRLKPLMGGKGSVNFAYDWSSAGLPEGFIDHIIAVLEPTGAQPRSLPVTIDGNGLSVTESLSTGVYNISFDLYSRGVLAASLSETLQIFDGMDSEWEMILGPEDFRAAPAEPGGPTARQNGQSVTLTWDDASNRETGYRVMRSAERGEFVLIADYIPANTETWTDTPVEPGRSYRYRIVAINEFGESVSDDIFLDMAPLVEAPPVSPRVYADLIIGEERNLIPIADLLSGFRNNLDGAGLELSSVVVSAGTAKLERGNVVVDLSSVPYEAEGTTIALEYAVHIVGQPLNAVFTGSGSAPLLLVAPEVEEIREEDLLPPVIGFVYDDRSDLERKMRVYEPLDPAKIFDQWGRILGGAYFENGADAESSSTSNNDAGAMASWWKLKGGSGGSYLEYAKNSVYAGLVSPKGEESGHFSLEATVSSKDDDDDVVGIIVAYVREGGANYVLEAARSQGALSGGASLEPSTGWGLMVRRLEDDGEAANLGNVIWSRQLDLGGISNGGWRGAESRIRVERREDAVSILASDWNRPDAFAPEGRITIDLSSHPELRRFRGARSYGYFVASQERSSFRDIVIDGGIVRDKLFLLDIATGESEIWYYDQVSKRWFQIDGASVQDVLGYPLELSNPETGRTFLVERRGFRNGGWRDWLERWRAWTSWDRRPRNGGSE